MWLGERQARVIEDQRAENAALLERLGKNRPRFTDAERKKLAEGGPAHTGGAAPQVMSV
jgi:hypothetical protein